MKIYCVDLHIFIKDGHTTIKEKELVKQNENKYGTISMSFLH
jgi:hypothetical protein